MRCRSDRPRITTDPCLARACNIEVCRPVPDGSVGSTRPKREGGEQLVEESSSATTAAPCPSPGLQKGRLRTRYGERRWQSFRPACCVTLQRWQNAIESKEGVEALSDHLVLFIGKKKPHNHTPVTASVTLSLRGMYALKPSQAMYSMHLTGSRKQSKLRPVV